MLEKKEISLFNLNNYIANKPCSVLFLVIIIYLRFPVSLIASICLSELSYQIWISSLRGLPRFTSSFLKKSSLWRVCYITMVSFRLYNCRYLAVPSLIYSTGTNTTIISDCASMDFPNIAARLSHYIALLFYKNLR